MIKNINKEELSRVLDGLAGRFESKTIGLFRSLVVDIEIEEISNYDEFYLFLIYPFEQFIDCSIMSNISVNYDVRFLLSRSQFIENHLRETFHRAEGLECCADKARTIIKSLINFYKKGKEISFNYDGEYTYHLPKNILKTHGECVAFYEAVKALYHGNPDKYVFALNGILETNKEDSV